MTKAEILIELEKGKIVSHRFFSPGEWVKKYGRNNYQFEDGVGLSQELFWHDRQGQYWEIDWEIFEE